jgi:hypothetical protein
VRANSLLSSISTMKPLSPSLLLAGASVAFAAPLPASATAQGLDIPFELQNILENTDGSNAYTYSTSLTRGIVPVHVTALRQSELF